LPVAFAAAIIMLAGDFNTLDDSEDNAMSRSSLQSIVKRPTRGTREDARSGPGVW